MMWSITVLKDAAQRQFTVPVPLLGYSDNKKGELENQPSLTVTI